MNVDKSKQVGNLIGGKSVSRTKKIGNFILKLIN